MSRGRLNEENYALIHGLPTTFPSRGNARCATLAERWGGSSFEQWEEDVTQECAECHRERQRRNRLLTPEDAALQETDLLDAPHAYTSKRTQVSRVSVGSRRVRQET